jgi:hypothetical protein
MRLEASRWSSGQTARDRSDNPITNTVITQTGRLTLPAIFITDIRTQICCLSSESLLTAYVKIESSRDMIVNTKLQRTEERDPGKFLLRDYGKLQGISIRMSIWAESKHKLSEYKAPLTISTSRVLWQHAYSDEDDCLLGCYAVQSGRNLPTLQRCLLPPTPGDSLVTIIPWDPKSFNSISAAKV